MLGEGLFSRGRKQSHPENLQRTELVAHFITLSAFLSTEIGFPFCGPAAHGFSTKKSCLEVLAVLESIAVRFGSRSSPALFAGYFREEPLPSPVVQVSSIPLCGEIYEL